MNKPVLHGVDDPLRIWEGQVDVQDLSRPFPADVEMRWKPSPQLRVNFVGDLDYVDQVRVFTTSSGGELRNREGRIVPPLGRDGKPAVRFLGHPLSMSANLETIDMSGGTLLRAQGGDSTAVARIRFVLVNFPPFRGNAVAVHDGGRDMSGLMVVDTGQWRLELQRRIDARDLWQDAKARRGFVVTHTGIFARTDGRQLSVNVGIDELLSRVQVLFSFLRSTWTSALVPIGLDKDGDEVWQDWSIPHVTEAADEIRWLGLPSDPYVPDRIAEFVLVS